MAWLASMSSATQVHELILQWFGQLHGKHPHFPFPWYLYLGHVKKQLEINCHWGERMGWRNWANLESFLGFPAAGLVLWAVRKSDGIPFRNLTLDCSCAAFQELSCWQTLLRVIQIQARPCSQEDGFSFKTCASRFGISLKKKKSYLFLEREGI